MIKMLHPAQTGTKTEASLNYGRDGDELHPDYEDEMYDKFLSIPFVENDENDEESMLRRMTSSRLSRFVGCGILLTAIAALATALGYYVHMKDSEVTSDDTPHDDVCYENPSCLNVDIYHIYDSNGWTNNTGWSSSSVSTNTCCNICLPGMNSTVCFPVTNDAVQEYRKLWSEKGQEQSQQKITKEGVSFLKNRNPFAVEDGISAVADCENKNGYEDYDYVVLDFIYFPQWCNALAAGHDPTVSHLSGTRCTKETTSGLPQLNIHGLWPNYINGYPQCCKALGADTVATLDPAKVETWDAYTYLQTMWYDPTTDQTNSAGFNCAVCYLLNHEWEKHGSCFSPEKEEAYFASGVEIALALVNQTHHIQNMNGTVVKTSEIAALYNHTVNVICDPKTVYVPAEGADPQFTANNTGVFMELQTCWDVVIKTYSEEELLADEDDTLLSDHELPGGTGTLIIDHTGEVSVTYNVREWKQAFRAQYGSTSRGLLRALEGGGGGWQGDFATFYGRNCTAALAGTTTEPCKEYAYLPNYKTD